MFLSNGGDFMKIYSIIPLTEKEDSQLQNEIKRYNTAMKKRVTKQEYIRLKILNKVRL